MKEKVFRKGDHMGRKEERGKSQEKAGKEPGGGMQQGQEKVLPGTVSGF